MSTKKLAIASAVLVASSLVAGGCVRRLNDRHVLGASVDPLAPGVSALNEPHTPQTMLSRTDWTPRVYTVPVDGTVHGPVHHRRVRLATDTARQETLFPTPSSALDLQGDSAGAQMIEGVLEPLSAGAQFLTMPLRLAVAPPWAGMQSPRVNYKRYPDDGWSSGAPSAPMPDAAPAEPTTEPPTDLGETTRSAALPTGVPNEANNPDAPTTGHDTIIVR